MNKLHLHELLKGCRNWEYMQKFTSKDVTQKDLKFKVSLKNIWSYTSISSLYSRHISISRSHFTRKNMPSPLHITKQKIERRLCWYHQAANKGKKQQKEMGLICDCLHQSSCMSDFYLAMSKLDACVYGDFLVGS